MIEKSKQLIAAARDLIQYKNEVESKLDNITDIFVGMLSGCYISDHMGKRVFHVLKARKCVYSRLANKKFDDIEIWGQSIVFQDGVVKVSTDSSNIHFIINPLTDKSFNIILLDSWKKAIQTAIGYGVDAHMIDVHQRKTISIFYKDDCTISKKARNTTYKSFLRRMNYILKKTT